jgi:hypothetical protein
VSSSKRLSLSDAVLMSRMALDDAIQWRWMPTL